MKNGPSEYISFAEFEKVKLQAGTIIRAKIFAEAIKPAYKLWIRFNNDEIRKSSAQITVNYKVQDLINRQVICVVNLKPRQIGGFMSEVLITGFSDENGNVVLAIPDGHVSDGSFLY